MLAPNAPCSNERSRSCGSYEKAKRKNQAKPIQRGGFSKRPPTTETGACDLTRPQLITLARPSQKIIISAWIGLHLRPRGGSPAQSARGGTTPHPDTWTGDPPPKLGHLRACPKIFRALRSKTHPQASGLGPRGAQGGIRHFSSRRFKKTTT